MNQFDVDISLDEIKENEFLVQIADTWQINVGPNGDVCSPDQDNSPSCCLEKKASSRNTQF